jgi:hypothetical protein
LIRFAAERQSSDNPALTTSEMQSGGGRSSGEGWLNPESSLLKSVELAPFV